MTDYKIEEDSHLDNGLDKTVGGISSAAVRSALVASSRSHRENGENGENKPVGENGENTPVGDDGGNRPVRKHNPVGKKRPVGDDGGNRPSGSTSRSGEKVPTGPTGRTYPSGIASPDEPEGLCIAASGGDAQSSFAIVAIYRVFKELVVRNFCIVNQVGFFGNTHIEPPLPTRPAI